jgi:hypothetical protein
MCEVPDALTTGKADKDAKMLPVDGIKITRVQQERIDSDDLGMKQKDKPINKAVREIVRVGKYVASLDQPRKCNTPLQETNETQETITDKTALPRQILE